ncbi:putative conjugative transfer protein TraN [Rickettsia hoogstraalii str. RCCE3]|nr:putative conjugative transfer protein TraN [Rickettsia hoogstraalii str. RCCE3]
MLVTLVMNAISSYSATMEDSYNSARQYEHSIKLGNPDQMGNKIIFDKGNISNLSKMNDQDLTNQGSVMLNNSAQGQLLQQSELKKINAMQEYDLNPDNP